MWFVILLDTLCKYDTISTFDVNLQTRAISSLFLTQWNEWKQFFQGLLAISRKKLESLGLKPTPNNFDKEIMIVTGVKEVWVLPRIATITYSLK